jgi:hypothetical protein
VIIHYCKPISTLDSGSGGGGALYVLRTVVVAVRPTVQVTVLFVAVNVLQEVLTYDSTHDRSYMIPMLKVQIIWYACNQMPQCFHNSSYNASNSTLDKQY